MQKEPEIHVLDLNFQGFSQITAAYLVVGPQGPFLVETGPGSTLETLISQIRHHGFQPRDVKNVLVTHIHLDHAGAAGWWAQQGANIYVHHFGARHLIQPDKLLASAGRIYGEQMDTLWGEMLPAPSDRVTKLFDGDKLIIAGVEIQVIETPGHARHHHVFALGDIAFMGDAAAVRLPDSGLIDLPAPPPEFDLTAWEETLDLLLAQNYRRIYPTHFGPVTEVQNHLEAVKHLVRETAVFIKEQMAAGHSRDAVVTNYEKWFVDRAAASGLDSQAVAQYAAANPLYMSVDGIMRYWQKQGRM